jgi:hypothetical protein
MNLQQTGALQRRDDHLDLPGWVTRRLFDLSSYDPSERASTRGRAVNVLHRLLALTGTAARSDDRLLDPWLSLSELVTALEDLERGLVAPVLKPTPSRHVHPEPRLETEVKAISTAACRTLVAIGVRKQKAGQLVAQFLNDKKYLRRPVSGLRVTNWRRRFRDDAEEITEFSELVSTLRDRKMERIRVKAGGVFELEEVRVIATQTQLIEWILGLLESLIEVAAI